MADEHVGADAKRPPAWTKIFTGFKVALDLKKLVLAAAGILVMWFGWWLLSWAAYGMAHKPDWIADYAHKAKEPEQKNVYWTEFKSRRASWNLLYELAGDGWRRIEPADVANSWQEYEALDAVLRSLLSYDKENAKVVGKDNELKLEVLGKQYPFTVVADPRNILKDQASFPLRELTPEAAGQFQLGPAADAATIRVTENADALRNAREEIANLPEWQRRIRTFDAPKQKEYEAALATLNEKILPREKGAPVPETVGGRLRVSPWTEYRGENPYLLITRLIKETNAEHAGQPTASPRGSFVAHFVETIPVLLEPLRKILTPIVYLFSPNADWYVKIYLVLVLLWALAVWGFFGGAITRLAAVQVARNEKIPLREALVFAKDRFVSFFAAPAFPLLLLAILVICLWLYGWVEGFLPAFGDIIVAGLLWPIVLIVGLIMAVVLVGLVGWPLMNPTISAEGSDSFDALSRSYSYVYQSPWHYLWYAFLATVYGAVLVFFVGFMASLMVFLGKWGVSMTPGISSAKPESDREPSYLFVYAPTSFGWRDLLIHNSKFAAPVRHLSPSGLPTVDYEFTPEYQATMTWYNKTGAVLVAISIGIFFLLVVGFGYSYFWTASTIIYFLMRRHVDDTDLDEVHLEEDEALEPFARPSGVPSAPAATPKSDKVSLAMVDAPTLRTGITPGPPAATPPPPASPPLSAPPPAAPPEPAPPPTPPPVGSPPSATFAPPPTASFATSPPPEAPPPGSSETPVPPGPTKEPPEPTSGP
jgi:hypothetical protein